MFRIRMCSPTFLKVTTICDVSHVISFTSPLFFSTREEGLGTRLPSLHLPPYSFTPPPSLCHPPYTSPPYNSSFPLPTSLPLPLYSPIVPPAPATNLRNTTYKEDLITITWMNGYTPITGAIIQYTPKGGPTRTRTITSTNLTMVTLLSLMPLTNYIISVSVFSIGGTSVPAYSQIRTLSRSNFHSSEYSCALQCMCLGGGGEWGEASPTPCTSSPSSPQPIHYPHLHQIYT